MWPYAVDPHPVTPLMRGQALVNIGFMVKRNLFRDETLFLAKRLFDEVCMGP
jgi:hypothetical protein